jgi:hypothetical protein
MRACRGSGPRRRIAPAGIAGFLALASAQPAASRRMRAAGLACLGAGAGLTGADLRGVRGIDVICRSGGVIAEVRAGPRPRAVPVLARGRQRLLAAARFAGSGLVTGGDRARAAEHHPPADPVAVRRGRAAPAGGLPAAGDLAGRRRGPARPATAFMHAAGITCSQRPGDLLATLQPAGEAEAAGLLGGIR